MVPTRYRVVDRHQALADTVTLELAPVDEPLDAMRPGQFTMLWGFGVGEVPVSLAAVPDADDHIHHTIRAVGAVTRALAAVEEGDIVGVRGPFGTGWDLESAAGRDLVVVAGGIGLAPLRPLITAVLADRPRYGRLSVLVGGRSPDALLYTDELRTWAKHPDVDVLVTVDASPPEWSGHVGVVTELVALIDLDPGRTTAFVCGPEVMMRFVARTLLRRGLDATDLRVSLERNMTCAIAQCGRCQLGPVFVCREGPVLTWDRARTLLEVPER